MKTNIAKKFFREIELYDDFNQKYGYEFLHHNGIDNNMKDCLLTVCRNSDCRFRDAYDKESFIFNLVSDACETYKVWLELNPDFNLNNVDNKREFILELYEISNKLNKEFGLPEGKEIELGAYDEAA